MQLTLKVIRSAKLIALSHNEVDYGEKQDTLLTGKYLCHAVLSLACCLPLYVMFLMVPAGAQIFSGAGL